MVVDDLKAATLVPILQENIGRESRVMTDEAGQHKHLGRHFADHGFVRHGSDEYVLRDDPSVHTNTIDGYFSPDSPNRLRSESFSAAILI